MLNEIKNEELQNKCIKCGKTNDLVPFIWDKKVNSEGRRIKCKIHYTSCQNCKSGFESYIRFQNFMKRRIQIINYILFVIFWLSMIFSIIYSFVGSNQSGTTFGFILAGISLFLIFAIYIRYATHPSSPKKFIKVDRTGNIVLKHPEGGYDKIVNITEEIDKKVEEIQETSHKFCPKCGSNIKTSTGFCKVCGKNLKLP